MTTTENIAGEQPRLKARYRAEIKDALNTEFAYENVMQIPGIVKVVVNMGVGDAARDAKLINGAVADLAAITLTATTGCTDTLARSSPVADAVPAVQVKRTEAATATVAPGRRVNRSRNAQNGCFLCALSSRSCSSSRRLR